MVKRSYGQYCGFARALELVGERWALLIVRDLLVGPKRFGEIQRGLPGIPTNILTTRLNELEDSGLVRRRVMARPAKGVAYELTEAGATLQRRRADAGPVGGATLGRAASGRNGYRRFDRDGATHDVPAGGGRKGEAHLPFNVWVDIEVHARIRDGAIAVGRGPVAKPDCIIEAGPDFAHAYGARDFARRCN